MVVKAVLEWQGPAGFDDDVAVAVRILRLGNTSFDVEYTATCNDAPACIGLLTYVSVVPGTHDSTPIPSELRAKLSEQS